MSLKVGASDQTLFVWPKYGFAHNCPILSLYRTEQMVSKLRECNWHAYQHLLCVSFGSSRRRCFVIVTFSEYLRFYFCMSQLLCLYCVVAVKHFPVHTFYAIISSPGIALTIANHNASLTDIVYSPFGTSGRLCWMTQAFPGYLRLYFRLSRLYN